MEQDVYLFKRIHFKKKCYKNIKILRGKYDYFIYMLTFFEFLIEFFSSNLFIKL